MASQQCDGCGERVSVAGGIAGIWSTDHEGTGGIQLELADGSEHFLCYACIDRLPDDEGDVTAEDIEALE